MGLSRNKVSLRERGDGSPPFYGERKPKKFGVRKKRPKRMTVSKAKVVWSKVLFSFEGLGD